MLALEEPLRSKCREMSISENRGNARNVILTEIVAAVTSRASLRRGRPLRIRSRDPPTLIPFTTARLHTLTRLFDLIIFSQHS